jgi:NADH-quinone oxidoreductase subunit H
VTSLGIPAAAAVVAAVTMTGSLRMEDIVRGQGGCPWAWTLFKSPPAFGLLVVWAVTGLARGEVEEGQIPGAEVHAAHATAGRRGTAARLFSLAGWAHVVVMCAVATALFLGGWQIPGLAPEQMEGHFGWTLAGAVLFALKTWLAFFAVVTARRLLPPIDMSRTLSFCWRWLVPLSLLFVLLATAWAAWRPSPMAETLVGAVSLGMTLAFALRLFARVRELLGGPEPEVDPFI